MMLIDGSGSTRILLQQKHLYTIFKRRLDEINIDAIGVQERQLN